MHAPRLGPNPGGSPARRACAVDLAPDAAGFAATHAAALMSVSSLAADPWHEPRLCTLLWSATQR